MEAPPVVVAGPEGSGTNMLTVILASWGLPAVQRSLPYAGVWWAGDGYLFDPATGEPYPEGTRLVVITRRGRATVRSVMRRHLASNIAMARLAWIEAFHWLSLLEATHRVSYEALVRDPRGELDSLAAALGVPPCEALPEIRDENAKYGLPSI